MKHRLFKAKLRRNIPKFNKPAEPKQTYFEGSTVYCFQISHPDIPDQNAYILWEYGDKHTTFLDEDDAVVALISVRKEGKVQYLSNKENEKMFDTIHKFTGFDGGEDK